MSNPKYAVVFDPENGIQYAYQSTFITVPSGGGGITFSDWAPYTPTLTGLGTTTNVAFFFQRIGNTVYVKGFCQSGSVSGAVVSITLPGGTAIDYSRLPNPTSDSSQTGLGFGLDNPNGGLPLTNDRTFAIFADGSSSSLMFVAYRGKNAVFEKGPGDAMFSSTDSFSCEFSYPV